MQWLSFVLLASIGIVLVPFLIRELGRDVYGLAILLGVIVGLSGVADIGLRAALGRHLSEALASGDIHAYNSLAASAAAVWLTVGCILSGLCVVFSGPIVAFMEIPIDLHDQARLLLMLLGGASIFIAFIQPLFNAILSSHNRFDVISRLNAFQGVSSGLLLFVVLSYSDTGIYGWAAVTMGCKILLLIASAVFACRVMPEYQFSFRLVSIKSFRKLISLSGYLFFLNLTNLLSSKADPIILSRFLGPASLALYNPGLTLSSRVRPLVLVLANQLYPVTTKFHTTGNDEQMKNVLFVGTRLTLCMGIGVFAILGIFSQSICRVWLEGTLGEDYQLAGYVLLGWALIDLAQAAAGSQWPVMIGKDKVRFVAYTQFPLSILNISASVYFVTQTELGVVGVVVPTVVIGVFRRMLTTLYVRRLLRLGYWEYLREAYLRPLIVFLIIVPVGCIIALSFPADTLIDLLVSCLILSSLWALLFFAFGVLPQERRVIYDKVMSRFSKL